MITRHELAEQVRDLIGEDRLEDALRLLTEHRGVHNLRNDVAMLAGRLERLQRQERLQTESFDELNKEHNRIREAILQIASDIEAGRAVPTLSKGGSFRQYAIIVMGVLLLAAAVIYLLKYTAGNATERIDEAVNNGVELMDTTDMDSTGISGGEEENGAGTAAPKNDTVVVASARDFIRGLKPGAILKFTRSIYLDGIPASMEQSKYINYSKSNSSELELTGLDSVTFLGPIHFYSSDLNSDILSLDNCSALRFREITFRHNAGSAGIGSEIDPEPAFTLNITNSENISFEKCHLYGKAMDFNEQNDALSFVNCKQLSFVDCLFEYYIGFMAAGSGSNGVFFQSTTFNYGINGYQTAFYLKGVTRAMFTNCTMKNLEYDQMFQIDRQLIVRSTDFNPVSYNSFAPGQARHLNFDSFVSINGKAVTGQNIMDIESWGKL